ncbi:phosphotransferase system cellobiose-specific component IIB [Halobacteroides halobius DSM 5150]|uniref:Phosphotransferase system cellobiose-specific component IIB n=1 Tax=Halobacteroides halobius (strain ATCC 35273 / DSM 5150 / MD-1) TaxID=748449 RepID=L0KCZ2_HALHC|nr:PTS sugar transporter subunit IIB [Halobacteroides halobius]AGB42410.1 phosphotransferase system cellobiose-specific component IIB [Halobacteroides halobius DSM 5150]
MNILLVCAMGASTGVMVNKMKKKVQEKDEFNEDEFKIEAVATEELKDRVDEFEVVLLGPQIRFKEAEYKKMCEPKGIKVGVIDSRAYGTMNAEAVLNQAADMVK